MADMLPCLVVKPHEAQLVAFDNDGTLYPAGEAVGRVVLAAHREYVREQGIDLPTPDISWVRDMIGADAKTFYASMLPGLPRAIQQEFEDFCLDYERQAVAQHPQMYEGMEEVLEALRAAGRTLVVVTNGGPSYLRSVWDACGYDRFFAASYPCAPPEFASKAERLRRAMVDWGGGPAVFVGDRVSDREAATEAGAVFVGCAYGYGARAELDGARYVVRGAEELYNLLLAPQERAR